ncbi:acyltransferase family protein [Enterobacter hormaechei]|uniref:acyltransferase family protein n=1 Tax=Enterobacter hormaechei TaxID=158836 RepID=UPI0021AD556C|nr:acyltransferase family protein [Enterobacter hormaechei]MDV5371201.1 acyltransferase family protein [Enterobacter hormaechei]MDV5637624.1 acyltransferase family protein [Enterobacter hormaechei]
MFFFHAKFPISGGFVGVDVFFVISGFLITSIINKEITNHEFTFSGFYLRRIKRIIPAFVFMSTLVSIYCFYYLMPDDLISYAKSLVYAMGGISNFYFLANTNYFESTTYEPLLHTWSLAVEEQFYVIFPFILLLLNRLRHSRFYTLFFVILYVLSIAISHYFAVNHKDAAYYMLPFRFFELMTGAMTAIFLTKITELKYNKNIVSITGATLIAASAFIIDDKTVFPGLTALPVCLGTIFLILSRGAIVNSTLELKPVVYIGKLSYSLYLWHWPVIILMEYRGFDMNVTNAWAAVGFSFVMSIISLHLIENPIRKTKIAFPTALTTIYLFPLAIFGLVAYSVNNNVGYPYRIKDMSPELMNENSPNVVRAKCIGPMKVGNFDECNLGINKSSHDGIMIGDSFGNAYSGFINALAKDAGLSINDTMKSSTPSIPGVFVTAVANKISDTLAEEIADYNTRRTEYGLKQKIVILSEIWGQYDDRNKAFRVYDKNWNDLSPVAYKIQTDYIKKLISNGVKVVIIARPWGGIGQEGITKLRSLKQRFGNADDVLMPYSGEKNSRLEYRIKREIPEVILIDPNDAICNKNAKCHVSVDNTILFRTDGLHLNYPASEKWGQLYLEKIGNPLKG